MNFVGEVRCPWAERLQGKTKSYEIIWLILPQPPMRRKTKLAVFVFLTLLSSLSAVAKDKERDWQTGILRDSSRSRYFAGTVGNANTNGSVNDNGSFNGSTSSSEVAVYRVYQNFEIEGDQYVYLARSTSNGAGQKPLMSLSTRG